MTSPSEMRPLMFALLKAAASWDEEGTDAIMGALGVPNSDMLLAAAEAADQAAAEAEAAGQEEAAEQGRAVAAAIRTSLDGIADRDAMIFSLAAWVNMRATDSIEARLVWEMDEGRRPSFESDGELHQAATAEWVALLDGFLAQLRR